MRRTTTSIALGSIAGLAALAFASPARATNAYEFPDIGTEQMARGSAWVARASDPIAVFANPGAIVTQRNGVALNVSATFAKTCFARYLPGGQPESGQSSGPDFQYPTSDVCTTNGGSPQPNLQLAAVYHVTDKLAIGAFIGGPSAAGKQEWPQFVEGTRQGKPAQVPSPQRYMLLGSEGLVLLPTVAASYQATSNFSFGAGFVWGFAPKLKFQNISTLLASAGDTTDKSSTDSLGEIELHDYFFPGVVAGALYQPARQLDVGAWFHASDDIRARGDLTVTGEKYYNGISSDLAPNPNVTSAPGLAYMRIKQPMQARVGFRYHQPRADAAAPPSPTDPTSGKFRDPIADDVFDVELDLTWSGNSKIDDLVIRFPANKAHPDPIYITWLPAGSQVPANADVPHNFKDVFGVRLGGDYVVVRNKLSVRGGGFFETRGQDPAYANVDFVPGQRIGLTAGGTYRMGNFDVLAGFMHIFVSPLDNEGHGALYGIAGNPVNPGPQAYRTPNIVNNGKASQSISQVSLGATYHF